MTRDLDLNKGNIGPNFCRSSSHTLLMRCALHMEVDVSNLMKGASYTGNARVLDFIRLKIDKVQTVCSIEDKQCKETRLP